MTNKTITIDSEKYEELAATAIAKLIPDLSGANPLIVGFLAAYASILGTSLFAREEEPDD